MKLVKAKDSSCWPTTRAGEQLKNAHPESCGKPAVIRAAVAQVFPSLSVKILLLWIFILLCLQGTLVSRLGYVGPFTLTAEEKQLSSQARWFVYSHQVISMTAFTDPWFKEMLNTAGHVVILTRYMLLKYIEAEFGIYLTFLKHGTGRRDCLYSHPPKRRSRSQ